MNGPSHYRAAEELLAEAETSLDLDTDRFLVAAQVHASLAVAAATLEVAFDLDAEDNTLASEAAWRAVLS